jgi:hypothetical protein
VVQSLFADRLIGMQRSPASASLDWLLACTRGGAGLGLDGPASLRQGMQMTLARGVRIIAATLRAHAIGLYRRAGVPLSA